VIIAFGDVAKIVAGKKVYKFLTAVFTHLSELALEQRGAVELAGGDESRVAAEETPSVSTFPICLSRACLGKSSLFSIERYRLLRCCFILNDKDLPRRALSQKEVYKLIKFPHQ
jgi:hypothetical protein